MSEPSVIVALFWMLLGLAGILILLRHTKALDEKSPKLLNLLGILGGAVVFVIAVVIVLLGNEGDKHVS